MINALFSARDEPWDEYEATLRAAFSKLGLEVNLSETLPPEDVHYIIYAPNGPVTDFTPFTQLKAVLSLWAGVEKIVRNESLKVPLCRMVDPGLSEGMVEWITGHVLRHHLGMDAHVLGQDGAWREGAARLARHRSVGILGVGALGTACARALTALNFDVHGWSRSLKVIEGATCHSGDRGLHTCLAFSEILVILLPLTDATENILDAAALAHLPQGAFIINAGRGQLIDDDALVEALDSGHVAHATLDVFRTEPLPASHRFWAHPSVTVTPHIAAETRPHTSSEVIAENIRRSERGEPMLNVVDRAAGY